MTTTTDFVRLVRNADGVIIESHDANPQFEAMQMEIRLQANIINDLRELLKNTRSIALDAAVQTFKDTMK